MLFCNLLNKFYKLKLLSHLRVAVFAQQQEKIRSSFIDSGPTCMQLEMCKNSVLKS